MPGLTQRQLLLYALPYFAVQMVFLPVTNFVPGHYSGDLGVPLAAVSFVMLASRFIDIFTDPLIGVLSDRTKLKFGRRKTWVALGIPVMMAGAWLLFAPPPDADALYLFCAISLAYLGFTMIQIPYAAWGAELSDDYNGRNRIAAWREGIGIAGTLTAISSPLIAMAFGFEGLGPALFGLAVATVVLLPLLMAPSLLFVPERADAHAGDTPMNLVSGLQAVAKNKDFLWFAGACFIMFIGVAPGGAMGYLMMEHTFKRVDLYPYVVLAEFIAMLVFLPFWVWCAGRIGKHRAIGLGLVWMAAFTFPVPWVGYDHPEWIVALSALRGIGFGALFVIPYALLADVIDVDTLRTGRQRSGLFMAFGGMNLKFSLMLGVFISTLWPTFFGFEPSAPSNTAASEFQVAVSYAWISCLFLTAAAPVFWFFPLTQARQVANREAIEARARAEGQTSR
jgi:glycoside/pentoside/hexuronide:cation symporter, GPH family